MYPGMPNRMERDIKALYLEHVLKARLLKVCFADKVSSLVFVPRVYWFVALLYHMVLVVSPSLMHLDLHLAAT